MEYVEIFVGNDRETKSGYSMPLKEARLMTLHDWDELLLRLQVELIEKWTD